MRSQHIAANTLMILPQNVSSREIIFMSDIQSSVRRVFLQITEAKLHSASRGTVRDHCGREIDQVISIACAFGSLSRLTRERPATGHPRCHHRHDMAVGHLHQLFIEQYPLESSLMWWLWCRCETATAAETDAAAAAAQPARGSVDTSRKVTPWSAAVCQSSVFNAFHE